MSGSQLSAKEQALLDAARREVRARRAPQGTHAPLPPGVATTPMDQRTVLGWDNPAAAQAGPQVNIAPEKWSQIAALMDEERRAEAERRAQWRKVSMYVLLGIALAALAFVLAFMRR